MGVIWAQQLVEKEGWDIDIVDLRTLLPIDWEAINESVIRTHRVLILHEDTLTGGIGGDISAYISEHLFEYLDAPVMRVGSLDTPVPFAGVLEQQFLPPQRLHEQMLKLLSY
jgi:2-oxoisovalerate dehydrogenase E1 component